MKAVAISFLCALVGIAAIRAAGQPPPQTPAFRTVTDLVEVDVVVQDKSGRFVGDLALDDFELQQDGKPQQAQQFYLHVAVGTAWSGATPTPSLRTPDAPQPPGTNRRTFVVVFDSEHLTPGGFKRTQAGALTLFSKQFRDGDLGGVVSDGRIANGHLTTDRQELVGAVRDAKPNAKANSRLFDELQWPRLNQVEAVRIVAGTDTGVFNEAVRRACADDQAMCQNADLAVRGKASQLDDEARASTNQTLQNLKGVLNGLSRIEGRKNVLLLSEGFLADESWPLVQEAIGLAARADTRIYTLDARGLAKGLRTAEDLDPGGDDMASRMLAQSDFESDSINSLAVDTGGFVVRNTNAFDRAMAQIAEDAGNYYILGYRPAAAPDGKFHRISVTVKRRGVSVRARRGFVATLRPVPPVIRATAAAEPVEPRPSGAAVVEPGPAPEPVATPAPTPEPVEATIVPQARNSSGLRVRPDASKHVDLLIKDEKADEAAAQGWEAYQRGDVATARASLLTAAASPSAEVWVHYALGMADYALRQYPDAVGAWERVLKGAPDFEPVYFDLVDAYLQLKDHDKAIRVLRSGKDRWPHDPDVFNALGVVQVSRGALDDAIKSFEGAIAQAPNESTSYFNLGKALEMRYYRSRHYVQQTRTWMSNENDRTNAIHNYERYLADGGAYAASAREGLTRLKWVPSK